MITMNSNVIYRHYSVFSPPEIIRDLETAMTAAGLPRLDFDKPMKFPLPFLTEQPMTFYGHSLSPPEGYIAHNFAKQFHVDKHWTGSPGGAYWNLKPGTLTHQADMEYGANFFICDYGLRRNCELQKCLCYLEYFIVAWYELVL